MTTFAIFYDINDLNAIAAAVNNPGLTPQERQEINRYWNAGLRDWQTAPTAPDAQACTITKNNPANNPLLTGYVFTDNGDGTWKLCDPNIKVIVMSGSQVSKSGLINWLRTVGGKYPSLLYMQAIADDIALTSVEPWTG